MTFCRFSPRPFSPILSMSRAIAWRNRKNLYERCFRPDLRHCLDRHVVRLRALRLRAPGGAFAARQGSARTSATRRSARPGGRACIARRGRRDRRHEARRKRTPERAEHTDRFRVFRGRTFGRAHRGPHQRRRASRRVRNGDRGRGLARARLRDRRRPARLRRALLPHRDESRLPRLHCRERRHLLRHDAPPARRRASPRRHRPSRSRAAPRATRNGPRGELDERRRVFALLARRSARPRSRVHVGERPARPPSRPPRVRPGRASPVRRLHLPLRLPRRARSARDEPRSRCAGRHERRERARNPRDEHPGGDRLARGRRARHERRLHR